MKKANQGKMVFKAMKTMGRNMCSGLSLVFLVITLVAFSLSPLPAAGSGYPNRTITLVVPLSPGGEMDTFARAFAEPFEKLLKQPVVVINKTGGGMTVAGNYIASSKPDGYTLCMLPIQASLTEVYSSFRETPYSSKDLTPISQLITTAISVTVKGDSPWNSLEDLVEYAKKNPGTKIGTQGVNSLGSLFMMLMAKANGTTFKTVPFRGGSKIVAALLGGHVPIGTPAYSRVRRLNQAKKLKTLALMVEERVDFDPDMPTVVEYGYKLPYVSFVGLFGPKGMPPEVVKVIEESIRKISEDPSFRKKMISMGIQVDYKDSSSFQKKLMQDKKRLQALFKEKGLVK
ncbi:MAG: tripartite tricarboxylate transporter substrate binding protein [Deltaproteobacteria bacterium]|nr:tripartite tricarboxylate transporter substrate binding protein [Deltaproteobacteria bacterium]